MGAFGDWTLARVWLWISTAVLVAGKIPSHVFDLRSVYPVCPSGLFHMLAPIFSPCFSIRHPQHHHFPGGLLLQSMPRAGQDRAPLHTAGRPRASGVARHPPGLHRDRAGRRGESRGCG